MNLVKIIPCSDAIFPLFVFGFRYNLPRRKARLTRPIDFRHGDFHGRTSLARVKVTGKQFVCLTGR